MNLTPTVRQYMTLAPKTIASHQTLKEAGEYMRKLHVRHLPVLRGSRLAGVISAEDIYLSLAVMNVDALRMPIETVMSSPPFIVAPHAELRDVAEQMAKREISSALVVDSEKGRLMGIFTTTDALRALAEIFKHLDCQPA